MEVSNRKIQPIAQGSVHWESQREQEVISKTKCKSTNSKFYYSNLNSIPVLNSETILKNIAERNQTNEIYRARENFVQATAECTRQMQHLLLKYLVQQLKVLLMVSCSHLDLDWKDISVRHTDHVHGITELPAWTIGHWPPVQNQNNWKIRKTFLSEELQISR